MKYKARVGRGLRLALTLTNCESNLAPGSGVSSTWAEENKKINNQVGFKDLFVFI